MASGMTMLAALIKSKVSAVVLGPIGLGQAAEIMQLVTLCMVPLGLVTGPAFVTLIARARGNHEVVQRSYDGSATLILVLGLVLTAAVGLAAGLVFGGTEHARAWALLAATWAIGAAVLALPAQVLMASGRTREFALFSGSIALALALIVSAGTFIGKLNGQFVAMAVGPAVLVLVCFPLYRRVLPGLRLTPRALVDGPFVRSTIVLGVSALLGGLATQAALSTIRWSLSGHGGDEANGQFQAAWAVGSAYFGLVLSGIGSVYFPRFAAAPDARSLSDEIGSAADFVIRTGGPIILVAIAVREPAIKLLYSGKFAVAAEMVGYQMAGDLAKAVSWAHAGPLLYRGKVRLFLITEGIGAGLLATLSVILVVHTGVQGPSYAYAVTYVVYAFVTALVISRGCGVTIRWRSVFLATGFAGVASAAVFLSDRFPILHVLLIAIALVWAQRTGQLRRALLTCRGVAQRALALISAG